MTLVFCPNDCGYFADFCPKDLGYSHLLRDPRIKSDEKTIAKLLQGHWRQEHIFELAQALKLYRTYQVSTPTEK